MGRWRETGGQKGTEIQGSKNHRKGMTKKTEYVDARMPEGDNKTENKK